MFSLAHLDPHPGNILLLEKRQQESTGNEGDETTPEGDENAGKIGLIDWGSCNVFDLRPPPELFPSPKFLDFLSGTGRVLRGATVCVPFRRLLGLWRPRWFPVFK